MRSRGNLEGVVAGVVSRRLTPQARQALSATGKEVVPFGIAPFSAI
jgi:hypothetical protein